MNKQVFLFLCLMSLVIIPACCRKNKSPKEDVQTMIELNGNTIMLEEEENNENGPTHIDHKDTIVKF